MAKYQTHAPSFVSYYPSIAGMEQVSIARSRSGEILGWGRATTPHSEFQARDRKPQQQDAARTTLQQCKETQAKGQFEVEGRLVVCHSLRHFPCNLSSSSEKSIARP